MAKVKVKMNSAGCIAVLNSESVQGSLLNKANNIKTSAGSIGKGSYVADVKPGRTRAHAMVKTDDYKACLDNSKHNTLLKAMGGR